MALDENGKILGAARAGAARGRRLLRRRRPGRAGGFALRFIPEAYDVPAIHVTAQGRVHQHLAARALSRRRAPRGGLFHRAADRAGGGARSASTRPRSAGATSSRRSKLPYATPTVLDLRQRRVRSASSTSAWSSADWNGLRRAAHAQRRRAASCAAARVTYLHRAGRHLQRAHGSALRSERHGHHPRRHAFARPGPRDDVRADGAPNGSACRSRTSATCRATPTQVAVRPRHLCGAQRRWSAAARSRSRPTRSSRRRKPMAAALMEAAAADLEFKDGKFRVVGTDKAMPLVGRRQGVLRADGPHRQVRRRPGGQRHLRHRSAATIRTAATSARSRSIPRPAR